MSTREIGALGEAQAVAYLKKNGYKILETNFSTIFGEIDIIARDKKDIVFIEVKLRRTKEFGFPEEAVNERKQSRIIKFCSFLRKDKTAVQREHEVRCHCNWARAG